MLIFLSFLSVYKRHCNVILNNATDLTQLGLYANDITDEANYILRKAADRNILNQEILQTQIFKAGRDSIHDFIEKFK